MVSLIVLTGSSGSSNDLNNMHIVPVVTIVGTAHLVRENAASGGIDSVWLVNNYVDPDIYCTVYQLD